MMEPWTLRGISSLRETISSNPRSRKTCRAPASTLQRPMAGFGRMTGSRDNPVKRTLPGREVAGRVNSPDDAERRLTRLEDASPESWR